MDSRTFFYFCLSILVFQAALILSIEESQAEPVRVEFSGRFTDCDSCQPPLSRLINTPFRGVLELDYTGAPPEAELLPPWNLPPESERTLYRFTAPSFMSITTGADNFELYSNAEISMFVTRCVDTFCLPFDDFINIEVIDSGYYYYLGFAAPEVPLENTSLPDIHLLRTMRLSNVTVIDKDFRMFVWGSTLDTSLSPILQGEDQLARYSENFLLDLLPAIIKGAKRKRIQ